MELKKSIGAVLATLAVSSTGLIALAPIASAGNPFCERGKACLWSETSYNGWKSTNEDPSTAVYPAMNNNSESIAANGGTCGLTRFYDEGRGPFGKYIYLFSESLAGHNYRDPDLSNGAGFGAYANENWANRISWVEFGGQGCN